MMVSIKSFDFIISERSNCKYTHDDLLLCICSFSKAEWTTRFLACLYDNERSGKAIALPLCTSMALLEAAAIAK